MNNIITVNEVFQVFAKLQLWFHLSHYYRVPGFFLDVPNLIDIFDSMDAAYDIIFERVMMDPEAFRESHNERDRNLMPRCYEHGMEEWLEECSQIDDLFFCIAVCLLARDMGNEETADFFEELDEEAESEEERNRLVAVLSTMCDLRVIPDELAGGQ